MRFPGEIALIIGQSSPKGIHDLELDSQVSTEPLSFSLDWPV